MKLRKMNLDDFEKMINKVIDFLWKFVIGACIVGFLGTGLFMILAYGIPLGSYERDMEMVFRGIQMIVVLLVIVMVGVAWWKILKAFLDYLYRKHGDFSRAVDSKRWPKPSTRTVQKTLIYMSGRVGLLVWDIFIGVVVFSFGLAFLPQEDFDIMDYVSRMIPVMICWFLVRCCFILYYHFRNYSGKMLHYYMKYLNRHETVGILQDLEDNLKNKLLYYSRNWIITEEYFVAWCDLDTVFHPIVIPVKEMLHLRYETRKRGGLKGTIYSAVIVCKLRSGKTVELYVGNWTHFDVIWKVLEYFKIPFENTRVPERSIDNPGEIIVTDPKKIKIENERNSQMVSMKKIYTKPELVCIIGNFDSTTKQKIMEQIRSGQKITAVKETREVTGLGLADAKWIVDHMEKSI